MDPLYVCDEFLDRFTAPEELEGFISELSTIKTNEARFLEWMLYCEGASGIKPNVTRAASCIEIEFKNGNRYFQGVNGARVQLHIGNIYAGGLGIPKNDEEAVKWFRKAADQGNARAQNNLGAMFQDGRGVPKNDEEAVKWLRKAADQGSALAQNNLGYSYASGQGVSKNDEEAVKWYRMAADQGNAFAQNNLGAMYENGRGVPKNNEEAVKWYQAAAAKGDENAKQNLARINNPAFRGLGGIAKLFS